MTIFIFFFIIEKFKVGLSKIKETFNECLILPNLRPDIFTGIRAPPKGI